MHMNALTTPSYEQLIQAALPFCLTDTALNVGKKYRGKVRDTYDLGNRLILITTDRQSAFDRVLASVPFKGQVLNLTSGWWFEQTAHLVANHMLAIPDPNVLIAKKCQVFPIEFVVRGYITGTTNTSLWTQYQKGVRNYCGIALPEGLVKNQKLAEPLLTPTTKEKAQDRPISPEEIIAEGWMSEAHWEKASAIALKLYEFGVQKALQHGLLLVDTKYELGLDEAGEITLVDEIHTPDSSRYWIANSYAERLAKHEEPENIDKEFLRLWFVANCDPYVDKVLPEAPEELIVRLSARYIELYETITGNAFQFPKKGEEQIARIMRNIAGYLG